jgi:hypothetical protein
MMVKYIFLSGIFGLLPFPSPHSTFILSKMSATPRSLTGGDDFKILIEESGNPTQLTKDDPTTPPIRRRPVFFRSTLFQIFVVGLCAFCAPGIWSAMNGLGVGGSQSPNLINAANALLYAFMTVTCFAGPWLTNLICFRWTLAIDSLGYPLYAAGIYVNNRFGSTWFLLFGSVACGISAGFFWSVEGAISTGYLEQHKRGRYLAT